MATPVTVHPATGSTLEAERDRFNANAAARNSPTITTIGAGDTPYTVPDFVGDPEQDFELYLIDDSSAAISVTVPLVSDKPGRRLRFQLLNGANGATITRAGADDFQGSTNSSLATQWELLDVVAGESTVWHVLAKGVTAP